MRYIITMIFIAISFASCGKPIIVVLKDSDHNKYFLLDSVKAAFNNKAITKTPLITIDGVIWTYSKDVDTVLIPLKKDEIKAFQILHKTSSHIIYGEGAVDGAIIINTIHLK